MGITIKDIAKECGVSVATVSMALSDKPSRVSENTKKKVREIAKNIIIVRIMRGQSCK